MFEYGFKIVKPYFHIFWCTFLGIFDDENPVYQVRAMISSIVNLTSGNYGFIFFFPSVVGSIVYFSALQDSKPSTCAQAWGPDFPMAQSLCVIFNNPVFENMDFRLFKSGQSSLCVLCLVLIVRCKIFLLFCSFDTFIFSDLEWDFANRFNCSWGHFSQFISLRGLLPTFRREVDIFGSEWLHLECVSLLGEHFMGKEKFTGGQQLLGGKFFHFKRDDMYRVVQKFVK
jgi:hypothetical protein